MCNDNYDYVDFETVDAGKQRRYFTEHGSIKVDPDCPPEIIQVFADISKKLAEFAETQKQKND